MKPVTYSLALLILLMMMPRAFAGVSAGGPFGIPFEIARRTSILNLADPPLPMLKYPRKGILEGFLKPLYFDGDFNETTVDTANGTDTKNGKISGWGAGAAFSYVLKPRWGLFGFAVGNSMTGWLNTSNSPTGIFTDIGNLKGTFVTVSGGLVREFQFGGLSVPVFFGPALTMVKGDMRVKVLSGSLTVIDADFSMDDFRAGFITGAHTKFNVGKHVVLNPFIIAGMSSFSDEYTPDIALRTDNRIDKVSATDANRVLGGEAINVNKYLLGLGLNVAIKEPVEISLNITSPFLQKAFVDDLEGFDLASFTLTFNFGNLQKKKKMKEDDS